MHSFDPERERALLHEALTSSAATPSDLPHALFRTNTPGFDQTWLESKMIRQSLIFYNDLLPVVFAMCSMLWRGEPLRIADIGANSCAGAAHISDALNNLTGYKVKVTGFDTDTRYALYAAAKFPQVEFVGADFLRDARPFDLALCSHTLEHIPEPQAFVSRVLERVGAAIFYTPYNEQNLIRGHVNRITDEMLRTMPGIIWAQYRRSVGWRTEGERSRCVSFVCVDDAWRARAAEVVQKLNAETMVGSVEL